MKIIQTIKIIIKLFYNSVNSNSIVEWKKKKKKKNIYI